MTKDTALLVIAGTGLLVAGGIALLATRSVGPVPMTQFTEQRMGPLMEHVVTEAELANAPVYTPHFYPSAVAPGVTNVVRKGFSFLYEPADPQIAALPAEQSF